MWSVMFWPIVACVWLPRPLVYLGLHVVTRGIIFLDIAIATMASLGICVAVLLHLHLGGLASALVGFFLLRAVRFGRDELRPYRRRVARLQLPDRASRMRHQSCQSDRPPSPHRLDDRAHRRRRRIICFLLGGSALWRGDCLHVWRLANPRFNWHALPPHA